MRVDQAIGWSRRELSRCGIDARGLGDHSGFRSGKERAVLRIRAVERTRSKKSVKLVGGGRQKCHPGGRDTMFGVCPRRQDVGFLDADVRRPLASVSSIVDEKKRVPRSRLVLIYEPTCRFLFSLEVALFKNHSSWYVVL